ncbi:O-antigen biosynthesis glycosyltransferase WbnK [bioreactor metagenome]|uniref:O-antigen biosynthesis glycosyltransferase WbnK n=1 Tax=bioreactor metagenome TaxID=1076179 RepID=A0A645HLH3_9ZZZZ
MHIRRGDYVNTYSNYYHILDDTYYLNAIAYIRDKCTNTKLFVFSDDIEWAQNNYKDIENIIFVAQNKSYEDMYLMSLCKHNIIANSSFSWWGAWLNENDNKIVIAPKKWFKNEKMKNSILPKSYIKI